MMFDASSSPAEHVGVGKDGKVEARKKAANKGGKLEMETEKVQTRVDEAWEEYFEIQYRDMEKQKGRKAGEVRRKEAAAATATAVGTVPVQCQVIVVQ